MIIKHELSSTLDDALSLTPITLYFAASLAILSASLDIGIIPTIFRFFWKITTRKDNDKFLLEKIRTELLEYSDIDWADPKIIKNCMNTLNKLRQVSKIPEKIYVLYRRLWTKLGTGEHHDFSELLSELLDELNKL